jgi:hypothetical protein
LLDSQVYIKQQPVCPIRESMFSRSDGPTALRADLVRALAFSVQQCDLERPGGGTEPAVAAIAAVWNGRKGFVALVIYRIESQDVERYVFADAIDEEAALAHATEEGLAFAESFGFGMDVPEFMGLEVGQQEQRLRLWDKLRKPRLGISAAAPPRAPQVARPVAGDIDPDATPTPIPTAEDHVSPPAAEASAGRAVLGRIELVRRGSETARPDALTRLLSLL